VSKVLSMRDITEEFIACGVLPSERRLDHFLLGSFGEGSLWASDAQL